MVIYLTRVDGTGVYVSWRAIELVDVVADKVVFVLRGGTEIEVAHCPQTDHVLKYLASIAEATATHIMNNDGFFRVTELGMVEAVSLGEDEEVKNIDLNKGLSDHARKVEAERLKKQRTYEVEKPKGE